MALCILGLVLSVVDGELWTDFLDEVLGIIIGIVLVISALRKFLPGLYVRKIDPVCISPVQTSHFSLVL